eukprot:2263921-Rhodomonas_salina.1
MCPTRVCGKRSGGSRKSSCGTVDSSALSAIYKTGGSLGKNICVHLLTKWSTYTVKRVPGPHEVVSLSMIPTSSSPVSSIHPKIPTHADIQQCAQQVEPRTIGNMQERDLMRSLPGGLIARAWPPERVVLGMRVCK